jgi:hypothetical protein
MSMERADLTVTLQAYLDRVNMANDFDLDWRWDGKGPNPLVVVFERTEGHELVSGPLATIVPVVAAALDAWGLHDPDLG